ncbi:MAG: FeS-binding protein [Desulfovibrio sp.]|uniref:FeS-binding protein n=1 Tax=Desulfovibrio sp. TaxID=885 RepID=UPI00135D9D2D|nr:FeS-binding protein [Desulfovibrio sp.]MTJ91407.1 FeS-binding protein [Desulfovibrio sp.]
MKRQPTLFSSFFSLLWFVSMLNAVWSGIAHLPLMSRYGLVHSANWSPSVWHYYSAAALLFLGTYAFTIWRLQGHSTYCLTRCGLMRVVLLIGLAVTGLALIVHNMPDYSLFDGVYAVVKMLHLTCALALLPLLIYRMFRGWKGGYGWLRPREEAAGPCRPRRRSRDSF